MATRRPNLRSAALELGIAAAAFVAGLARSPTLAAAIAFVAIVHWAWTRRAALREMRGLRLLSQVGLALAVLLVVLAGCYFLGSWWRGISG